ncbi:M23 family metallopeptidase [Calidifontibacter terrae]
MTALVASAVAWGSIAGADGSSADDAAAEARPASVIDRVPERSASNGVSRSSLRESAAMTAKVQAATKSRAAALAAATSQAAATRTLTEQRANALRSLTTSTPAAPYAAASPSAGAASAPAPSAAATRATGPLPSSGFTCPIAGCGGHFTSGFGHRASPGGIGSTNHQGIDLSTPIGTPLRALHGGTVTAVGWYGGQGKRINVDIGGGVTIVYAHLSGWAVTVGQHLEVGQLVAFSGNTGNSTGPHLHLEVHLWSVPVNPIGWLHTRGIMF